MTASWIIYTVVGTILCIAGFIVRGIISYGYKHGWDKQEPDKAAREPKRAPKRRRPRRLPS